MKISNSIQSLMEIMIIQLITKIKKRDIQIKAVDLNQRKV